MKLYIAGLAVNTIAIALMIDLLKNAGLLIPAVVLVWCSLGLVLCFMAILKSR
jgi:hypothetical protein